MTPRQAAKALLASLIAGLSALLPGVEDGVSVGEGLTAVVAALVALGAVFVVPNEPKPAGNGSGPLDVPL